MPSLPAAFRLGRLIGAAKLGRGLRPVPGVLAFAAWSSDSGRVWR